MQGLGARGGDGRLSGTGDSPEESCRDAELWGRRGGGWEASRVGKNGREKHRDRKAGDEKAKKSGGEGEKVEKDAETQEGENQKPSRGPRQTSERKGQVTSEREGGEEGGRGAWALPQCMLLTPGAGSLSRAAGPRDHASQLASSRSSTLPPP